MTVLGQGIGVIIGISMRRDRDREMKRGYGSAAAR